MKQTIFAILMVVLFSSIAVFANTNGFVSLNDDASKIKNLVCNLAGVDQSNYNEYDFTWTKNGVDQGTSKTYVQPAASLTKGEVWTCEISQQVILEIPDSQYTGSSTTVFYGTASTTIVNSAPTITSAPVTTATAGLAYTYDVNANDPDGDSITYSLISGQPGMLINSNSGVISWVPSSAGTFSVTVSATDGTAAVTQTYSINVNAAPIPITVTLTANPTTGTAPLTVALTSAVSGGSGSYSLYSWYYDGDTIPTLGSSSVSHTFTTVGAHSATLVVTDSLGFTGQAIANVIVTNGTVIPTNNTNSTTNSTNSNSSSTIDDYDLSLQSIELDNYDLAKGDSIAAHVTLENQGKKSLNNLVITMSISDLGITDSSNEFDLTRDDQKTIDMTLDLPNDAAEGAYYVKFVIKNDKVSVSKLIPINVVGSQSASTFTNNVGNAQPQNEQVQLVSAPTISGYQPTGQAPKTNWAGVTAAVVIFLVLLGGAYYLIGYVRKQKKADEEVSITALDELY